MLVPLQPEKQLRLHFVMIKPCTIIFSCLAVGELIVWLTGISIPGSIIGMILLMALLEMNVIKLEWVKPMADVLVKNLGFFFIPPGVALMLYYDLIKAEMMPIVVATLVSTLVVLVVTGWTHQFFAKRKKDTKEENL